MSHELRTPLNAIIGYSELLKEEAEDADNDAIIPDLNKIRGPGKRLLQLINGVLDLSKIEAGKMELAPEELTVAELIEGVRATIEPLVKANHNGLEIINEADGALRIDIITKLLCMSPRGRRLAAMASTLGPRPQPAGERLTPAQAVPS